MLEFAAPPAPAVASGDLSRPLTLPPSPPPIMHLHRAAGGRAFQILLVM